MEETKKNIRKVFESKSLFAILLILGILIVASLIFSLGMIIGFHKANFEHDWEEHYEANFGMGYRNGSMMGGLDSAGMMNNFPNAHGAIGKIIKIELPNIIVEDKDNTEKVISTTDDTNIQTGKMAITTADLKLDDYVIVIGNPDDKGVIEAKLIRVIPAPALLTPPTPTN